MRGIHTLCWAACGLALLAAGCKPAGPPMGKVTGRVTFKGEPLPTGSILFIPETAGQPTAFAEVQPDGTYVAATRDFGPGVPVGRHRVMITAVVEQGPDAPLKSILPAKYGSDRQSGLTAEVKPGENVVDFSL